MTSGMTPPGSDPPISDVPRSGANREPGLFGIEASPTEVRRWFAVSLVGGGAILLQTLGFGFEYDHGDLQYVAWSALNGVWPYSGAWETSFPGGILIHALVLLVGGQSALAFRFFDLMVQMLTLGLLFKGTSKIAGPLAGTIAALLYAVAYVLGGPYHTAQRDGFMVSLILFALLAVWRSREKTGYSALCFAGLALGIVVVIKPTYAVLVAITALILFISPGAVVARRVRWGRSVFFALCGALPLLVVLFAMWSIGQLGPMLEISSFLKTVYVHLERSSQLRVVMATLYVAPAAVSIGAAVSLVPGVRRNWRFWTVPGLFAMCLLIRMIEAKSYSYQYWPMVAALAMMAGVGWSFMLGSTASFVTGTAAIRKSVVAMVVMVMVGASILTDRGAVEGYLAFAGNMKAAVERPIPFGSLVAGSADQAEMARYINRHSDAGDTVQLWGAEPAVLYAARRRSPSRFFTSSAFHCRHGVFFEHCEAETMELQRRWKGEFLDGVNEGRPVFIVAHLDAIEDSLAIAEGACYAPDFPQLREILKRDYTEAEVFGSWTVFRRK